MKTKNKIFLGLGSTISVVAPIATVVACGENTEVSQTAIEQREQWAKSQNLIETKYQEMLISKISATHETFGKDIKEADLKDYSKLTSEIKEAIVAVVKRNIYTSPSYLTTFAEKLIHIANPDAHKYETQSDFNTAVESIWSTGIQEFNNIADALKKGTMPTGVTLPTNLDAKTAKVAEVATFITAINNIFDTDQKLIDNKNSIGADSTQKLQDKFDAIKNEVVYATNAFKGSLDSAKTSSIIDVEWDNVEAGFTALKALVTSDKEAQDISKSKVPYTFEELTNAGFYDYYLQNTDVTSGKNNKKVDDLITKYMPVIWNENVASFRNVFYQYMISNYFLETNKEHWKQVFVDAVSTVAVGKINGLEGSLKEEDFVLGQKVLRAKLAYDWEISLDDQASSAYAGAEKDETELNQSLTSAGDIYKDATTTQIRNLIPSFVWDKAAAKGTTIWDLINENKDLIGFNGLVEKSTFASTDEKILQVTNYDSYDKNYEGYIDKSTSSQEIVGDAAQKVKLTTPSNSKVDIEKVIMLMPTYDKNYLTIEYLKDSKNSYTTLKNIIIAKQGSDIYKEAIQYYSSKDNQEFDYDSTTKIGGIRLTILDESLRKVATDTFGLDYVNKDE